MDGRPGDEEIDNLSRNNVEVLLRFGLGKHFSAIDLSIRLGARALHGRAFTTVQKPKLNAGFIRYSTHHTVECINFPDQMPFTQSTDRRIAGHHTDAVLG